MGYKMNFFHNYRKVIDGINNKNNSIYLFLFIGISCVLFLFFAAGLVHNPFGPQRQIFYLGTAGFYGDFYFVMYSHVDRDPYFSENALTGCYLPLTYMILNIFSKLDNYGEMTYSQVMNSKMAIMSGFFFIGFSIFLLFMSLNKIARKYNVSSIISISLILSYPFLFSTERGNFVVLSAALVGFFICYYDSKKKSERVLAAICLALATVFKITPVFFGFLYFEKKQYKEIFLSAIIAILLAFLPFLYFKGGFANILHLINILRSAQKWRPDFDWYGIVQAGPHLSLRLIVYIITFLFELPRETITLLYNVCTTVTYFMFFVSIIFSLLTRNKYLKIFLLSMAVIFFPGSNGLYVGLYLFPMIIIFFSGLGKRSKLFNIFALIIFLVFLNPYQIAIVYGLNITSLFITIALTVFWFVLLVYSGKGILANFKKRLPEAVRV
jgi:hypothetical protein